MKILQVQFKVQGVEAKNAYKIQTFHPRMFVFGILEEKSLFQRKAFYPIYILHTLAAAAPLVIQIILCKIYTFSTLDLLNTTPMKRINTDPLFCPSLEVIRDYLL